MMVQNSRFKQHLIRFFSVIVALQLALMPQMASLAAPSLPANTPSTAVATILSTPPISSCNSYLLADATSGDILFGNKPDERIYPASTTKIMTAILLLENQTDLSKTVTVGSEGKSLPTDAQQMGLRKDDVISYKDLLNGLLIYSAADAAMTIAVNVGGSVEGFAEMMNTKAVQLGMNGTHFTNPHGLNDDNHYTTASDLAKLAIYAMKNDTFRQVVDTASFKIDSIKAYPTGHTYNTTNKLISSESKNKTYNYQYAIGVKTGFTNAAGGCLIAAAKKGDATYIAVLMGDSSGGQVKRWTDAAKLFDFGFTQKRVDIYAKIKSTALSAVLPGDKEASKLSAVIKTTSIVRWMDAGVVDQLSADGATIDVAYALNPLASPKPTGANAVVGTVTYSFQGLTLFSCDLIKTPVEKPSVISDQTASLIKLVSIILLSLGALLLIVLILRRGIATRSRHNRRYSNSGRNSGGRKLRDPHDFQR